MWPATEFIPIKHPFLRCSTEFALYHSNGTYMCGNSFSNPLFGKQISAVKGTSEECEVLIPHTSLRCIECSRLRGRLRARRFRENNQIVCRTAPNSHVSYSVLSETEMKDRMTKLHSELCRIMKQKDRLKKKVETLVEKSGVRVDEELHQDLQKIARSAEATKPTELSRVFWEQQVNAAAHSDARGMRWHPLMIKWCICLRHLSQGAYETLRKSKCITLPSQRTLRDYTHHIKPSPGFSVEVDLQLITTARLETCEVKEKYVILLIDEMHIREDLVYDKNTCELIGFSNLGDINSQLMSFDISDDHEEEILANSVTTFMVKGLFSHLEYPYAYFPCRDVTGDQLFDPLWEAVFRLEAIGFKVMAITADGASVNRRLMRLHKKGMRLSHKTPNPFADDERDLFFISDVPHLIKTTRNCWASPHRQLWRKGNPILWDHLMQLYEKNRSQCGLVLLPKLRYEHLHLTNFSKMRVDLASQVLSESVSKALIMFGGPDTAETALFTSTFDKFFDCLNVSSLTEGRCQRKPFKKPYFSGSDFRVKWLEETFIPYLDEWEKSVKAREGFTKTERNKMMISKETLDGLKMTTKSFVELVQYLFKVPGVTTFYSRRLCQDPLEKFFGCQRQVGGTHDNTNIHEFGRNTQMLRVANFCKDAVKGNCRGNKDLNVDFNNSQPLPKRRKPSKSTKNQPHPQEKQPQEESGINSENPPCSLLRITHKILSDLNFPGAMKALEIAKSILSQASSQPQARVIEDFSSHLLSCLSKCFDDEQMNHREREKMWNKYHLLRTSLGFRRDWITFLSNFTSLRPTPLYYQQVTHELFKQEIRLRYETREVDSSASNCAEPLTLMEENVLRYVAGYVCRRLKEKLEASGNANKDEMIWYIIELVGDELVSGEGSEEWTDLIDRGGLCHISDMTYDLFISIEMEVRQCLSRLQKLHQQPEEHRKQDMTRKVMANEDVLFNWWILSTDFNEDVGYDLLQAIVEFYITIRGFSFAGTFVENYKKKSKKSLQRSKSLRKELYTSHLDVNPETI